MWYWTVTQGLWNIGSTGLGTSAAAMVDKFEETNPSQTSEDVDQDAEAKMTSIAETKPFAVQLRMIILLSLICWAVFILGGALIVELMRLS
jgi:hypothetical protein